MWVKVQQMTQSHSGTNGRLVVAYLAGASPCQAPRYKALPATQLLSLSEPRKPYILTPSFVPPPPSPFPSPPRPHLPPSSSPLPLIFSHPPPPLPIQSPPPILTLKFVLMRMSP